jgi:hypothetical protein
MGKQELFKSPISSTGASDDAHKLFIQNNHENEFAITPVKSKKENPYVIEVNTSDPIKAMEALLNQKLFSLNETKISVSSNLNTIDGN